MDYKETLILPATSFPMRGNLPQNESKIYDKYPSVRELFEDEIAKGYTIEEQKAIEEIFRINDYRDIIERKECFKLGFKEAYIFFEEQEMLKATKTFFVQSNLLLNFCKDCHSTFLKGNAEQKRKIVKMVCSNFSYDGSNIVIEPNPIFKAVIKNSLSNKKLPRLDSNQQPTG